MSGTRHTENLYFSSNPLLSKSIALKFKILLFASSSFSLASLTHAKTDPEEFYFDDPDRNSTYSLTSYNGADENYDALINHFVSKCNASLTNNIFNNSGFITIDENLSHDRFGNEGYIIARMIEDTANKLFEECLADTAEDYKHALQLNNFEHAAMWVLIGMSFIMCLACYPKVKRLLKCQAKVNNYHPVAQIEEDNPAIIEPDEMDAIYQIVVDKPDPCFQNRLAKLDDVGYRRNNVPADLRTTFGLIMNDPITVATGITYDRQELARRFAAGENQLGIIDCLVTGSPINRADFLKLKTNIIAKNRIDRYVTNCETLFQFFSPKLYCFERNENTIDQHHDDDYDKRLAALKDDRVEYEFEIPDEMLDLYSRVMKDPVTLYTGRTYDRNDLDNLMRHARNTERDYFDCPVTKLKHPLVPLESFQTDIGVKNWIRNFVEHHERQFAIHQSYVENHPTLSKITRACDKSFKFFQNNLSIINPNPEGCPDTNDYRQQDEDLEQQLRPR